MLHKFMSSLLRGHANLLCIIPILVYMLLKWAFIMEVLNLHPLFDSQHCLFDVYGADNLLFGLLTMRLWVTALDLMERTSHHPEFLEFEVEVFMMGPWVTY